MNLHFTPKPTAFATITTQPAALRSRSRLTARAAYLTILTWSFTLFNSIRVIAYLPTVLAILQSGKSDQHSLWTWCTWVGANATMACWLFEQNGQKLNRAVVVNLANTVMCAVTLAVIVIHRF